MKKLPYKVGEIVVLDAPLDLFLYIPSPYREIFKSTFVIEESVDNKVFSIRSNVDEKYLMIVKNNHIKRIG